MSVKSFLFNKYIKIQAKIIDKELEGIDWEKDYGLTNELMEELKERIYNKLMEQIRFFEEAKGNG